MKLTNARRKLTKDALLTATRLRRETGIAPDCPVCVYDLARHMGIEVRFLDLPSLEGCYSRLPEPVIVVASTRPAGRQVFTAGHELGHHVYGHGLHIDELLANDENNSNDDDEYLVDRFSGFLLMSKRSVLRGFRSRGWNPELPSAVQVFTVAGWLGVGYNTLINHMSMTLHIISFRHSKTLKRISPKDIKAEVLRLPCREELIVVDHQWADRSIDIAVDDYVTTGVDVQCEGACLDVCDRTNGRAVFRAQCAGLGRLFDVVSGWSSFVRVSRRGYVGRYDYRHLDEVPEEAAGAYN